MAIQKQEYYEGAALHALIRSAGSLHVRYEAPFFVLNDSARVYVKYSTRGRSPWGFSFSEGEHELLLATVKDHEVVVALVCGSDGVASLTFAELAIACDVPREAFWVSCYRGHKQHYRLKGPRGWFESTVAPSAWERILDGRSVR